MSNDVTIGTEATIMNTIYNRINDMVGSGNQLFSMFFPAQPLNYRKFQYDTSSRNSVLTRPFTVAEAEFRLSDQLYDIAPVTAGSNGEKLSTVYDTLINNYIPKIDYLAPYIRDRTGLAKFLLEESGEIDADGKSLTRIELCKKLYNQYLVAKNAWNNEKQVKFDSLRETESGLDDYAKWQSSEGIVKTEALNNLYNDVVVRGHLHEVMTIMGYLNSTSIAEQLEITKQKMRNSSRLALDESMTVYPVNFQPNNWFKCLKPNLNPEDLTMAQDSLLAVYWSKKRELEREEADLKSLLDGYDSKADLERKINDIEIKASAWKVAVDTAERELLGEYGNSVLVLSKLYLTSFSGGAFEVANASILNIDTNDTQLVDDLTAGVKQLAAVADKQSKLNLALDNLTALRAKQARLQTKDFRLGKADQEQRVAILHQEVDFYAGLVGGVVKANQATKKKNQISGNNFSEIDTVDSYTLKVTDDAGKFTFVCGDQKKIITYKRDASFNTTLNAALKEMAEKISCSAVDDLQSWTITAPVGTILKVEKTDKIIPELTPNGVVSSLTNTKKYRLRIDPKIESCKLDFKIGATENNSVSFSRDKVDEFSKTTFTLENTEVRFTAIDSNSWDIIVNASKELSLTFSEKAFVPSNLLPQMQSESDAEINGMFQDVVIKLDTQKTDKNDDHAVGSSHSQFNVNAFIASVAGQYDANGSTHVGTGLFNESKIEIGFRMAKVTFDRGGWFNPSILKMSHAFLRLADIKASGYSLSVTDLKNVNQQGLDNLTKYGAPTLPAGSPNPKGILPSFPVAMLIAKDITIRIQCDETKSRSLNKLYEETKTTSGGILCFSVGSGSFSSTTSEESFHGHDGQYYHIRIPGPQVLGTFLELVSADNSEMYTPLINPEGQSPILDALHDLCHPYDHGDSASSFDEAVRLGELQALADMVNS